MELQEALKHFESAGKAAKEIIALWDENAEDAERMIALVLQEIIARKNSSGANASRGNQDTDGIQRDTTLLKTLQHIVLDRNLWERYEKVVLSENGENFVLCFVALSFFENDEFCSDHEMKIRANLIFEKFLRDRAPIGIHAPLGLLKDILPQLEAPSRTLFSQIKEWVSSELRFDQLEVELKNEFGDLEFGQEIEWVAIEDMDWEMDLMPQFSMWLVDHKGLEGNMLENSGMGNEWKSRFVAFHHGVLQIFRDHKSFQEKEMAQQTVLVSQMEKCSRGKKSIQGDALFVVSLISGKKITLRANSVRNRERWLFEMEMAIKAFRDETASEKMRNYVKGVLTSTLDDQQDESSSSSSSSSSSPSIAGSGVAKKIPTFLGASNRTKAMIPRGNSVYDLLAAQRASKASSSKDELSAKPRAARQLGRSRSNSKHFWEKQFQARNRSTSTTSSGSTSSLDSGTSSLDSFAVASSVDVRLSSFDVLTTLGQGAYGMVKLVTHRTTGKLYALKIVNKAKVIDDQVVENVINERQILHGMHHPFVLRLYNAFQTETRLFLLLHYCVGGELSLRIPKGGFGEDQAKLISAELLLSIENFANSGIIHRDVKPDNVLIDEDGHCVLADFGLSKIVEAKKLTNTIAGTMMYMAPEMLKSESYDNRVDVWSLGVTIFELVMGFTPFASDNFDDMIQKILHDDPELPRYLSEELADLLSKLLNKDPDRRLGSKQIEDIRAHPWFQDIDFVGLFNRDPEAGVPFEKTDAESIANFEINRRLDGLRNWVNKKSSYVGKENTYTQYEHLFKGFEEVDVDEEEDDDDVDDEQDTSRNGDEDDMFSPTTTEYGRIRSDSSTSAIAQFNLTMGSPLQKTLASRPSLDGSFDDFAIEYAQNLELNEKNLRQYDDDSPQKQQEWFKRRRRVTSTIDSWTSLVGDEVDISTNTSRQGSPYRMRKLHFVHQGSQDAAVDDEELCDRLKTVDQHDLWEKTLRSARKRSKSCAVVPTVKLDLSLMLLEVPEMKEALNQLFFANFDLEEGDDVEEAPLFCFKEAVLHQFVAIKGWMFVTTHRIAFVMETKLFGFQVTESIEWGNVRGVAPAGGTAKNTFTIYVRNAPKFLIQMSDENDTQTLMQFLREEVGIEIPQFLRKKNKSIETSQSQLSLVIENGVESIVVEHDDDKTESETGKESLHVGHSHERAGSSTSSSSSSSSSPLSSSSIKGASQVLEHHEHMRHRSGSRMISSLLSMSKDDDEVQSGSPLEPQFSEEEEERRVRRKQRRTSRPVLVNGNLVTNPSSQRSASSSRFGVDLVQPLDQSGRSSPFRPVRSSSQHDFTFRHSQSPSQLLLQGARIQSFSLNELIVKEGKNDAEQLFQIRKGRVRLVVGFGSKHEVQVGSFGPGEVFGIRAFVLGIAQETSVIANEDGVSIYVISKRWLHSTADFEPQLTASLYKWLAMGMSMRLKEAGNGDSMEERLRELQEERGESTPTTPRSSNNLQVDWDDVTTGRMRSVSNVSKASATSFGSGTSSVHQLFGLPAGETVICSWRCSIDREVRLKGELFLTPQFLCFFSKLYGIKTKEIIVISSVHSIDRNGDRISVRLHNGKNHEFVFNQDSDLVHDTILSHCLPRMSTKISSLDMLNNFSRIDEEDDIGGWEDDVVFSDKDVALLLRGAILTSHGKGEIVLGRGETSVSLFQVVSGCVRVMVSDSTEVELFEGEMFGEISFLERGTVSADVLAGEDGCDLYRIDSSYIDSLLAIDPGFPTRFYNWLCLIIAKRL